MIEFITGNIIILIYAIISCVVAIAVLISACTFKYIPESLFEEMLQEEVIDESSMIIVKKLKTKIPNGIGGVVLLIVASIVIGALFPLVLIIKLFSKKSK